MNKYFPALFKPGKLGNVTVKNRIFKPGAEDSCCADGYVSDYLCRFYAEEARGGAGLIICGMYDVTPKEQVTESHPVISDDTRIPGMGRLAQAIKDNGARACCQLGHFGSHAKPVEPDGWRCVSYKPLKIPGAEEWFTVFNQQWQLKKPYPIKEYTITEIHELVNYYGDAARRAKQAGFDMVEVHGGHRHGLGCFLSPLTNWREDEYGGSVENRSRILYEIIDNIQAKCGKDYPIIVRLNGYDGPDAFTPYKDAARKGQKIEDTIEIAQHLEQQGVAAINISIQNANLPMQEMDFGVAVPAAAKIREHVHIPVLVADSIQVPDYGEKILEEGKADFIGTARQLFADPAWPKKAMRGERANITPCIRCMECVSNQGSGPLVCTVNPTVGKPDLDLKPAKKPRRVAVVGAGPAGMEAARVLALRGHRVTLFEKRKLGGMLHEAATPEFKRDIRRLITYYQNQINEHAIKVVTKEATAADLTGYDAVVVATGSKPLKIQVPGIDNPNVYFAEPLLADSGNLPDLGQQVVVIGGGSVGIETAVWLSQQGITPTIVEMRPRVLLGESLPVMGADMKLLMQNHVQVLTGNALKSIKGHAVVVVDHDGQEHELPADSVVMAVGLKPENDLVKELEENSDVEVYPVGDCIRPRKIFNAIHEGHTAGMEI